MEDKKNHARVILPIAVTPHNEGVQKKVKILFPGAPYWPRDAVTNTGQGKSATAFNNSGDLG